MTHDVIIIGLGAMGSAAAHHLARRGARVLGIDQFDVPHDRGSSHGRTRMIRLAYFEHPDYVPLLRRAYELWEQLSRDAGETLLFQTGGVYLGPRDCELIDGALRAAALHKLQHELLDRSQIVARFPQFQPPPDAIGVFEPAAGFLLPERVIESQVRLARQHGAEIRTGQPVLEWTAGAGGVTVRLPSETHHAGRLVIAAGAWMPRLVPAVAPRLRVTRQVLAWFEPLRDDLVPGQLPVFGIGHATGGMHYGFPVIDCSEGFKAALHHPGEPADPDSLDRSLHARDVEMIRQTIDQWLPRAAGKLLRHATCMYTNSPDGHFILDRHPDHHNVFVASCYSGHGFKFASVIGEIVADLVTTGATRHCIEFLSLNRFLPSAP